VQGNTERWFARRPADQTSVLRGERVQEEETQGRGEKSTRQGRKKTGFKGKEIENCSRTTRDLNHAKKDGRLIGNGLYGGAVAGRKRSLEKTFRLVGGRGDRDSGLWVRTSRREGFR